MKRIILSQEDLILKFTWIFVSICSFLERCIALKKTTEVLSYEEETAKCPLVCPSVLGLSPARGVRGVPEGLRAGGRHAEPCSSGSCSVDGGA